MPSQVFTTTGSQTWNWPAGVTAVIAEALGGGGGSGTASGNPATGGGGKGGSYAKASITKGGESLLTIVVGTGGAVAGAGAASTVDQASTIRVRAAGGAGGASQATSSANGAGGTTQNGTPVGSTLFTGGNGGTGNFTSGTQGSGAGGGAAGPTSDGGAASVNTAGTVGTGTWLDGTTRQVAGRAGVGNTTPGVAGTTYGGAASGGKASTGADQNGAVGGQGIVILTWDPTIPAPFISSTLILRVPTVALQDQPVTGGHRASTLVLRVPRVGDLPAVVDISRDSSAMAESVNATSQTWPHTIGATANCLIAGCKVYAVNDVTATFNGVAMDLVDAVVNSEGAYNVVWKLMNPAVGTHDIVVSRSGGANFLTGASVSYNGVRSVGAHATSTNTSLTPLPVAVNEHGAWLVQFIIQNYPGAAQVDVLSSRAILSGPPSFQYLYGMTERGPVSPGTQTLHSYWTSGVQSVNLGVVLAPIRDETVAVTDSFDRANGPIGSNWTLGTAPQAFGIVSNIVRANGGVQHNYAYWNADTPSGNHSSEVALSGIVGNWGGPTVRHQPNGTCYRLTVGIFLISPRIYKVINGVETMLVEFTGWDADNASWRLEAVGSTLRAYRNGVQMGSDLTDTTLVGGTYGIWGRSDSPADLNNWQGVDLVGVVPLIDPTSFVDWWEFDEASGNAVGIHAGTVLTEHGTIASTTLGGRLARLLERANGEYFSAADSPALSLGSGQSFTLAIRVAALTGGWTSAVLIAKDDGSNREFVLYYTDTVGFRWGAWDPGGTLRQVDSSHPTLVGGQVYTVIAWYDFSTGLLYLTVDDGTPVTVACSNVRDMAAEFSVGAGISVGGNTWPGSMSSVVYDKRVWTADERRAYSNAGSGISYATAIDGSVVGGDPVVRPPRIASTAVLFPPSVAYIGDAPVTTGFKASGAVCFAPRVKREGDLTELLVGHWPMNQSGALDPGYDVVGNVALTTQGSAQAGQNAIDGTPARDFEYTGSPRTSMSAADTTVTNVTNTDWTFVLRVKFESTAGALSYLVSRITDAASFSDAHISWQSGFGFRVLVNTGAGGVNVYAAGHTSITVGATYIVAGGWDKTRQKAWCRVNNGTRAELDCSYSYDGCDTFVVSGMTIGSAGLRQYEADGAIGPVSLWRRVLSDAEIDSWATAKGDYETIGGTYPTLTPPVIAATQLYAPSVTGGGAGADQAVTTQPIASTAQLYAPTVTPPGQDVTTVAIGSTAVLSAPTVAPPTATITTGTIASTAQRFAPTITVGPVSVTTLIRATTQQLFAPTVAPGPVAGTGGTVASTLQLFPPTVAAGPVAVTTGTRASTATLFSPTVGQSLTTSAILSTAALFAMTVVAGAVTIGAATISATTTLLTPMVAHAGGAGTLPTLNLTLHLDAADTDRLWKEVGMSTHPADTDEVIAWDDEADATNHAAFGSSGSSPAYRAAAFNGLGSLDFDGVNDVLYVKTDDTTTAPPLSTFITPSAAVVFLSFIMEGPGGSNGTFYNNDALYLDGSAYFGLMLSTIGGVHKLSAFNWDGSADFATVDIQLNTKYVVCVKHVGGDLTIDVNNGLLTATLPSGNTVNLTYPLQIGGGYFGSNFPDAKIGEVAFYNADVVGSDLADAWTYFMSKWVGGAPQFIDGATRTSTAVLYAPTVAPGPVTITAGTLASTVQAFAPTVAAGPVTILGATRLSLLQVFAPTVAAGPVAITTGTRASTLVLYAPTVAAGPVAVTTGTIASTGQRFAPSVTVGAVSVTTPAWAVSTQLFAPTVTALAAGDLGLTHIPSTLQLFPPTVTTGPVAITGGTRTSTVQLFAPSVANAQFVGGVTIPTTRVLYPPSVAVGPATVLAAHRASTLTLFAPMVAVGPVTILAPHRASLTEVFAPTVGIGAVTLGGAHRPSTLQLFAPSLTATIVIVTPPRATTLVLYPPSVEAPTLQTILMDLRRSTALLYPPRVWAPIVPSKDCAVAFPIEATVPTEPPGLTRPPATPRLHRLPAGAGPHGITPQLVPGASVNRYYITAKAPAMIVHDGFKGNWTSAKGIYGGPLGPLTWQWELSASKTNAGTTDRNNIIFINQSHVSTPYVSLWTPPLVAQTISGTFNWCWHASAIWRLIGGASYDDLQDVWIQVHAYITVGNTSAVRHVLINNHREPTEMRRMFIDPTQATSAAAPIAMTSGAAQDGDRIRIELGVYVQMPTPEPTQPPTNYTEVYWLIPGATGIDLTPGMPEGFFEQRSPWLQFSNALVEAAPSARPPNDTCATAIPITTLPYHSAPVDCSHSADINRRVWWTWVAPEVGEVIIHTFGSNYYASLDILEEDPADPGCGGLFFADNVRYYDRLASHRSLSTATLNVTVPGTRYWFRVRNRNNAQNVVDGGGMARLGVVRRATVPQQDDLYLPVGNILQVRDGQIVNISPDFNSYAVSGVAIDYTRRPMDDLNGGTHSGERLLVALYSSGLIETLDLPTLSFTQDYPAEIDYIDLPNKAHSPYGASPSTLHLTAAGQLHIATFGTGFEYVMSIGGPGSKPSYMSAVSELPADSETLELSATSGENQAAVPVYTRHRPPAVLTAPWAIAIDEATNTLYYVEGSFYIPVGGQTVKRFNLSTNTPLADFVTLGVPPGARSPGVKGLTFIPYDGSLLICNATQVVHVDASGSVVGTYTPSVPQDAQTLVDVKMQADGQTFWTVDLDTGRLFKVDLATMTELGTYETWGVPGSLTQMAIYQPAGISPPGPSNPACVLSFPIGSDLPPARRKG